MHIDYPGGIVRVGDIGRESGDPLGDPCIVPFAVAGHAREPQDLVFYGI
jgi:hypothetical protein